VQANLNRSLGHPDELGDPGLCQVSPVTQRDESPVERVEPLERGIEVEAIRKRLDGVVVRRGLRDVLEIGVDRLSRQSAQRLVPSDLSQPRRRIATVARTPHPPCADHGFLRDVLGARGVGRNAPGNGQAFAPGSVPVPSELGRTVREIE
jgi:hypothetical protein